MTPGPAVPETMQVSLPQYSTVYPSPTLTSNLWEARQQVTLYVLISRRSMVVLQTVKLLAERQFHSITDG